MAKKLTNIPTNLTEYPNSFKRQGAFPLEAYEVFYSKADAENYAETNPLAYVGQTLKVVADDTVKLYVIKNEAGDLYSEVSNEEDNRKAYDQRITGLDTDEVPKDYENSNEKLRDMIDSISSGGGGGGVPADLSNYYTKAEIDAALDGVADDIIVSEEAPTVTGDGTIWLQPIEQDIDYIIEQSISDDVYYEKWHSGIVKYYAKETHQVYGDGGDTISSGRLGISTNICKKVITHNVTATNLTSNAKVEVTCGEIETTPTDLILKYTLYFASMTANIETNHAIIGKWK